jgi:hypothetical protein
MYKKKPTKPSKGKTKVFQVIFGLGDSKAVLHQLERTVLNINNILYPNLNQGFLKQSPRL